MRTSREWREYYEQNAASLLDISWNVGGDLTQVERQAIASSLQGFQAGERSEGRHLYRCAEKYAEESGDHEYVGATRLFIAEEQRHARDLARFLELNDIPILRTTFPDRVFRWLRHVVGGLEISISVLITAEIIAKVYYAALEAATNSIILVTLCDQILSDEQKHVEFQAEQLGKLRARRSRMLYAATIGLQRFLYWGTCLVVWFFHGKVIRKGELRFGQFWHGCWAEFNRAFGHSKAVAAYLSSENRTVVEDTAA